MIEIRCESCFDFLPTIKGNSIDLVLIDPPYEISRETGFTHGDLTGRDTDRFRVSMEFGDWDSQFQNLDLVVAECFRILRSGGSMICFYDLWKVSTLKEYFDRAGFKQIRFIEWLKTNPVPLNSKRNYLTNAREIAVTGTKNGKPTFNSEYDSGVYRFPICHSKDRFHPTQKPLELIEELIRKHSNAGDLILDCFLGSGTTAIASKNLGRNFIGCEIDPNFYKKILERLQSFEGILSS